MYRSEGLPSTCRLLLSAHRVRASRRDAPGRRTLAGGSTSRLRAACLACSLLAGDCAKRCSPTAAACPLRLPRELFDLRWSAEGGAGSPTLLRRRTRTGSRAGRRCPAAALPRRSGLSRQRLPDVDRLELSVGRHRVLVLLAEEAALYQHVP